MNARDRADARLLLARRISRALVGEQDVDAPPPPPLRGLAWGVVIAILIAIVLVAVVLVADGRHDGARSLHARPAPVSVLVPAPEWGPVRDRSL